MTPSLAKRGKLILASGATFVVVGALYQAPPLVALGGLVIAALVTSYLYFFPTAVLLRRKKIELSWWVPPGDQPGGALSVERPFALHVAFRNHGNRPLRVLRSHILGTSGLELPAYLEATVPPGQQLEVLGEARAHAAGYQVLHGAVLTFGDALGLFDVSAYFPNPIAIKVFPRGAALYGQSPLRPKGGATHEQVGLHHVRRRGLAGELRELRDHAAGDPFKYIAWKATARKRKLMVRDLETEIMVTHQILVDMSGSMRGGRPGHTKLDYAIDTAAALARSALEGGDRVGLVTFDSRIYAAMRPGTGHHHYLKVVDRLLETHNVVDEDLTDLTNGELVAAVARYLAHQEAVDVRLRRAPALDDPAWEHIHAGPTGELYDVQVLGSVIQTLLQAMGQTAGHKALAPAWWWSRVHISDDSDPQMARLRLFCRLRGIELPYRQQHEHGLRAAGLATALHRISAEARADLIVLISDLHGVLERPDLVVKSLARARRGGQQVIALVPFAPAFAATPRTIIGHRVADALTLEEDEIYEQGRRHLVRHGIPVIRVGPHDHPSILLRRMSRARSAMRRVA
jgi:uncharacterized protein (DUF58 family)